MNAEADEPFRDDVVAERLVDTPEGQLSLKLFRPTRADRSWRCSFLISGRSDGADIASAAYGRDSMEALLWAIVDASMFFYRADADNMTVFGEPDIGLLKTTKTVDGDLVSTYTLPAARW
jgi:hypothetical protein